MSVFISFIESEIFRITITRSLSADEIKNHRIRVGSDIFKEYDPDKHVFEIIRREK